VLHAAIGSTEKRYAFLISELYGTAVRQAEVAIERRGGGGGSDKLLKGRNTFTMNYREVLQNVEEYQKYEIYLFGLITVSVLNKLNKLSYTQEL